jgi:hypothetical protein
MLHMWSIACNKSMYVGKHMGAMGRMGERGEWSLAKELGS